jgi:hypothetical protein
MFAQDPSKQSMGFPGAIIFDLGPYCIQKLIQRDKAPFNSDNPETFFTRKYTFRCA